MDLENQLKRLRQEWLKASPKNKKLIEMQAKIIKMGINSATFGKEDKFEKEVKEIFK